MFNRLHPFILSLPAGEHRLCGCGDSSDPPLCDQAECPKAIAIQLPAARTLAVCGCGRTRIPPYCDGRHGDVEKKKRRQG